MCVGAALLALRWLVGGRRLDGECTVFGMVEALHRREEGVAAERREVAASGLAQGSLRERLRAASVRGEAHAAAGGCTPLRYFENGADAGGGVLAASSSYSTQAQ